MASGERVGVGSPEGDGEYWKWGVGGVVWEAERAGVVGRETEGAQFARGGGLNR